MDHRVHHWLQCGASKELYGIWADTNWYTLGLDTLWENRNVLACTLIKWSSLRDCRIRLHIGAIPLIYLPLIFLTFSSLKYWVWCNGVFSSLKWFFLSTVACRIQVWNKLKIKFNRLDTYFKLENVKNQVKIDCEVLICSLHKYWNFGFDHRIK